MAATGRVETATVDSQRPRTDLGAGSLSPTKSHHWPPDPDSGHPREAVCSRAECQMGCIDPPGRRLLLCLSCYSGLRVDFASKQ